MLQNYYFVFLFVQNFLTILLSFNIIIIVQDFFHDLNFAFALLIKNLFKTNNYFFFYLILQELLVNADAFLQIEDLINEFIFISWTNRTSRQKWKKTDEFIENSMKYILFSLHEFRIHRQFEEILSESFGSLEASVIDMLMFDSETVRNKFELRFCFWTVSNWKSAVSLLWLRLELTLYHNFHHKHFCIKCFCCFKLRKIQKYIYCQRRRQFNRFQNRVYCV